MCLRTLICIGMLTAGLPQTTLSSYMSNHITYNDMHGTRNGNVNIHHHAHAMKSNLDNRHRRYWDNLSYSRFSSDMDWVNSFSAIPREHERKLNWTGAVNKHHSKRHRHHHRHRYHENIEPISMSRSVSDMFVDLEPQIPEEIDLHWPVKKEAIMEGDLILGGLMMVHSREDTIMCGPIMPQGGIQALEAMLYTLDRINKEHLLPNITIGAHILDDCDRDSYGLEMAVDFIKGKFF